VVAASAVNFPPAQWAPLTASLHSALSQSVTLAVNVSAAITGFNSHTPGAYRVLLEHANTVLLPQAHALDSALQAALQKPATPAEWAALFAKVKTDFSDPADAFAKRVQAALLTHPIYPMKRWRALLSEALAVIYDRRDTDYATLASWHNKTIFLVSCGLLLIVFLAANLENETLFLLGASGGLLSRLSRSLYRQDVQTDYGASWTTLFLSPVVGALTGWGGVLLVVLAIKLQVLGPLFTSITWDNSFNIL
jgi:hypothetical protein